MKSIQAPREEGMPVAVNVAMTPEVVSNLEAVFDFIEEQGFAKVILGCLVDVPAEYAVSTAEFYLALRRVEELRVDRGLEGVEIGNLEAYRRALVGDPDRVCTMFGSTCGSGFHNIIYMQRDVYPCARMAGIDRWKLEARRSRAVEGCRRGCPFAGARACGPVRSTSAADRRLGTAGASPRNARLCTEGSPAWSGRGPACPPRPFCTRGARPRVNL